MNRNALSPLMATLLLVVFALLIGTITMSWGKNYVSPEPEPEAGSALVISLSQVDTPLKELQIKYITGRLTLEEYLQQEQYLLSEN